MIYLKFLRQLLRHKWFVLVAGIKIGGVPLWRLIVHDWTKFSPSEFGRYARNFHGDYSSSPNDRGAVALEFVYAWLHHENRNPHHWGYWVPRSGKRANDPLPVPETYLREMVADFMGASRAYTGSWEMSEWLTDNLWKMNFHEASLLRLESILDDLGYHCEFDAFANQFTVRIGLEI
jgi:hypothetical protein